VGQFAAACLAGAFSLEESLGLVVARARVVQAAPDDRQKAIDEFHHACGEVKYQQRYGKVVTPAGQLAAAELPSAEYWRAQLDSPMDVGASISAGAAAFQKLGCGVFLEVGPKSSAVDPAVPNLKDAAGLWLAGLRSDEADWPVLLRTVSQLYSRGVRVDWEGVDRGFPRRRVSLPTYPFQRQRFWIEDGPADSSEGCPGTAPASAVVRLLTEGKLSELAAALDAGKTFSDEELRLLPKVLQALADQHRKESSRPASQPGA
jgi:acyl transferase domain-containing protein